MKHTETATPAPSVGARPFKDFCRANGISPAMGYNLLNAGKGPRTFTVGRKRLVSIEAEADWRRAMEEQEAARDWRSEREQRKRAQAGAKDGAAEA